MPVQLNSLLRERLQITDKKDAIELYYELLTSGHSVGEILEALNSTKSKDENGSTAAAEYSQTASGRASTNIAADIAPVPAAPAKTRCIPGLSTSHAADSGRTAQAQAAASAPLKEQESDNREQLPDNSREPEPDIPVSAGSRASTDCEAALRPGDQEQIGLGRFSWTARRIAFATLCATAIALAAAGGFSIVHIDRDTRLASARVPSSIPGGIETAAVPRAEAGRAEAVENKRVADANESRASEPLRSVEPVPVVPGPAQRVTAEVRAARSSAQPQAQDLRGSDAGQPNATRVVALAATASDPLTANEAPATATTQTPKPAPEAGDTALATVAGAGHRIEGDRDGVPAARLAEAARAGQPDAARPPAREAVALASAPRIPEKMPFKTAEADALVRRGDAFFAVGDLASARLFYEYAATAGSGVAALRLGGTFDPGFLARAHFGRVQGDRALALYWYRQARDLGNGDAEILLRKMENPAR